MTRSFRVHWRWSPDVGERARLHTRLAIGGWLSAIGFARFHFRACGAGQTLLVESDEELSSSARAIHSFVVSIVRPHEHRGPLCSGLRTSKRWPPFVERGARAALRAISRAR